ncbi:MAG: YidE/YbjL duplication [Synergistales bacterium]|nr:YidE/YbjL duplication [Synergistales bacterium]
MEGLAGLFDSDIFIMSLAVAAGLLFGNIKIKGIGLGTSGTLFAGLVLGLLGYSVSYTFFTWNLVIFVVAVGLLASEEIVTVVRQYGIRFIVLGIVVTAVGAVTAFALGHCPLLAGRMDPMLVAGAYTGALTSSPGLGAALELTGVNPLVTIGYTIAYPFGVVAVVLFVQLAPALFRIDLQREKAALRRTFGADQGGGKRESVPFALLSFVVCIVCGVAFGKLSVELPGLGKLSLGTTGGALIVALAFGALGRLGPLPMRMEARTLSAFRSLSLAYFLAVVGLMAGPKVLEALSENGLTIMLIGLVTAVVAELAGFVVGRYLFKINWVLLAGAICGAMTSTPGLGAAIDATGGEECGAGYGATYPVAIVCMVTFTKLLAF